MTKIIHVLIDENLEPVKAYDTIEAARVALFKRYVDAFCRDWEDPRINWVRNWDYIANDLGDLINLDEIKEVGWIKTVELEVSENE
jgi:hypothetical protein